MAERLLHQFRVFAVVIVLGVTVIAGGLILSHSYALAQQARPAAQGANSSAGNPANGKNVFSSEKCADCHGAQGQGGAGTVVGPRIAPPRFELGMFLDAIRNPKSPMPPYSAGQMSDAAVADVYAYLKSVAPAADATTAATPAGNAENGARLFTYAGCYECHDRQGQGGAGTGPRLAPNPIAFSAFIHQCRQPSDEMPPYTSKVLSDAEIADIYAFLRSVPQPPAAASIPLLR
jgi:mono/diheme cytochrome c family protein